MKSQDVLAPRERRIAQQREALGTLRVLEMDGADDFAYEAYHPDDFFVLVDDSDEEAVKAVIREQLPYWTKRRGGGDAGLVEALIAAGCPNFAARVDSHLKTLSGIAPK